jgi:hypothetical protein
MARDFLRTCVVNNTHVMISSNSKLFGLIAVDQTRLEVKFTMDGDLGDSSDVIFPSTWVFFLCLSIGMRKHSPFNKERQ